MRCGEDFTARLDQKMTDQNPVVWILTWDELLDIQMAGASTLEFGIYVKLMCLTKYDFGLGTRVLTVDYLSLQNGWNLKRIQIRRAVEKFEAAGLITFSNENEHGQRVYTTKWSGCGS